MKACSWCGETKADAEFARDASKRSGLRSWCRDCTSGEKARERAAALAVYGGVCVRCQTTDDLEFDHIDWNGWKHRQEESPAAMVRRIARHGRIDDYRLRVLCRRCHRSPGARERLAPDTWLRLCAESPSGVGCALRLRMARPVATGCVATGCGMC